MIIYYGKYFADIIHTINKTRNSCLISGDFTPFPVTVNKYLSLNNKKGVNTANMLKLFNINADNNLNTLSYFEHKKLAFLSALISNSSFIIFEEPSLFLSDTEKIEMADLLNLFKFKNIAVLEKDVSFCKKLKCKIRYLPLYQTNPVNIN